MMDELLEQFLIEGRDLMADAQAALTILRDEPGNARAIDAAFRAVHTLKGSVAIFAMAPAERVLHAGEDVLARARKEASPLPAFAVASLVAMLDQVDRWIDEMAADGAIGTDAEDIASALLDVDADAPAPTRPSPTPPAAATPGWAAALYAREVAKIAEADAPLVAFRYAPDTDAFFRGDDPITLVAGVPDLVAVTILPADGAWPALRDIDPFLCKMVIEGLSSATEDTLRAIFRLVPDQIALHPIDRLRPAAAEPTAGPATMLRVDASRIDALADGVGELVIASNALAALSDRADPIDRGLANAIRAAQGDLQRAVATMHRSISAVRLVPLAPALRRLPRLVREIAAELGKQVAFTLTGARIEVDKQIADGLFEPLLHLVRNALDHGIETPVQRAAAGKPADGKVELAVSRDGDDIVVTLTDDGAGMDPAGIRATAVARELIGREEAAGLSDAAALALIFLPGFSTAASVSGVSGRGVGMDAVQASVDRLRGRIGIDSKIGTGTRFTVTLPANALTTRLLVVDVADDRYAIPFDQIVETARVDGDRLIPLGTGTACVLRDRTVPVLSLARLLGGAERETVPARLVVTRAGGEAVALRVDGFSERIDAMVRRPTGLLAGLPNVAGTTLLGDGGVLLVLNLPELVA